MKMNAASKYKFLFFSVVMLGVTLCFTQMSCMKKKPVHKKVGKKVLVLGFDGMDPRLMKKFMERGEFPAFRKLMGQNGIIPLATSYPPQSPVAWSNFITGMNPGGHGIFDFIHRTPQDYLPYLSTSKTTDPDMPLNVGKYVFPIKSGGIELLRKGTAFWEILEERGVPTTIFRVPANFPPVQAGRSLSGMGTPDLLGGYGSFTYCTEEPLDDNDEEVTGGVVRLVSKVEGKFSCPIQGPVNSLLREAPSTETIIEVWPDPVNNSVKLKAGDETILLEEGDWSDWIHVKFDMIPHISSVPGIIVVYVKHVHPLQMYVSPVNIDPQAPAMPISYPPEYSVELADNVGPFYTQGMPEDTKALDHGILSDREYMDQNEILNKSIRKIYDFELNRFEDGLLFFYFSDTDLTGHMMWSAMDETHPAHSTRDPNLKDQLFNTYVEMDRFLGKAMEHLDDGDTLLVISDHGFNSFKRTFNLNTWLKENGYLKVEDEFTQDQYEYLTNVVWADTKAYSLGFNCLYINQIGREGQGIVPPGVVKKQLMEEIRQKLLAEKDPLNGNNVVTNVYFADEIYSGKYVDEAPDILVGYAMGYRGSWETAIGKVTKEIYGENDQKWSGDHLIDPIHVPGIVFSNKKIASEAPALYDIPVTILSEFGVAPEPEMIGKNIF